jgi:hypothetical protein
MAKTQFYTKAQADSAIAAAIAALVASAPAALDTLNELAAALGNDASFATTVTNALAGKAASSHTHAAADITSGTIATARMASRSDAGNSSTALTVDWSAALAQKVTLTGNCTFTFSNPVAGAVYVLELWQDGTGSRTVTWPASVKWAGGTAPTLTTTANKMDLITLYYDGTNYRGVVSGQAFA